MKNILVACAIIEKEGRILAAQRSESMSMPLKWEFPGGKIDNGETPEQCLRRELIEELGIEVEVGRPLPQESYPYSEFSITLLPFFCTLSGGEITLHEHRAFAWLKPGELDRFDWTEADLQLIRNRNIHRGVICAPS